MNLTQEEVRLLRSAAERCGGEPTRTVGFQPLDSKVESLKIYNDALKSLESKGMITIEKTRKSFMRDSAGLILDALGKISELGLKSAQTNAHAN
jgi:hypothetical protein